MIKEMNKKIKKLDIWDVALVKLSVAAGILFIVAIWPAAMAWVASVNPWYFLIAFVIVVIRPFYKFYLK